jgi:hypothetical protein
MATTFGNPALSARRRDLLVRRIRLLVAATIAYNVIEAMSFGVQDVGS